MPGSVNCISIPTPEWQPASGFLVGSNITIYQGITSELISQYHDCFAILSEEEKSKALRFRQEKDRQRYVLQHGFLRQILSTQIEISPIDIQFEFNVNKKPYLSSHPNCFFNLSNSAGHFLIAVSDEEIGVDIEHIKPELNYRDIARNYFGAAEISFIDTSPNPTEAFFLLWTRKEALLKASGMGIDDNLPAVPALDGLHVLPAYYPDNNWLTQSFTIEDRFMASVTVPSPGSEIRFIDIDAGVQSR